MVVSQPDVELEAAEVENRTEDQIHENHTEEDPDSPEKDSPENSTEKEETDRTTTKTTTKTITKTTQTTETTTTAHDASESTADTTSTSSESTASTTTSTSTKPPGDLKMLVITDLHFHPRYKRTLGPKCRCRTISPESRSCQVPAAPYGQHGCNSPKRLIDLSLEAAKAQEPELWLVLGDLVDHHVGQSPSKFKAPLYSKEKENEWGHRIFKKTLSWISAASGRRCLVAVGNNDIFPGYTVDFEQEGFYEAVAQEVRRSCDLSENAFSTLRRFGFYWEEIGEKMVLLVLNTVIYATKLANRHNSTAQDPFGQLAWLKRRLQAAQVQGYKVYIAGHIPPVASSFQPYDLWQRTFAVRYWNLLAKYGEVVAGQFFSHQHRDEFRVALEPRGDTPPPMQLFASVSPVFGNNPSFYAVEIRERRLHEYRCFWANLSEEEPKFALEYEASSLVDNFTNVAYRDLALNTTPAGQDRYNHYYSYMAVGARGTQNCDHENTFWVNPAGTSSASHGLWDWNMFFLVEGD
ncbi:unnamed protein product [Durusdinium trenchii]|uniref:Calcineurin-like phosphoesterase domain-containing protein n=1 Tax=Durusdinium trenchii TaxID=1381693 RepID=A0ABP0SNC1_9DINO